MEFASLVTDDQDILNTNVGNTNVGNTRPRINRGTYGPALRAGCHSQTGSAIVPFQRDAAFGVEL